MNAFKRKYEKIDETLQQSLMDLEEGNDYLQIDAFEAKCDGEKQLSDRLESVGDFILDVSKILKYFF